MSLFRFVDETKHSQIRSFSSIYDASAALQKACSSGAKHLDAEFGQFNLESTVTFTEPLTLEGAGDGTVFTQRSITNKASFHFKSSGPSAFLDGLTFRNFVMQCQEGTFLEQQHLISFNGVKNVVFEGLRMYGFRGDAIYLGSGVGADERHNAHVRIAGCVFDGINRENRNAISVIDGDGIVIEDNMFLRCTRHNMPGPIDFEPNANAWHVVRNVTVRRNRFRANGGFLAEIAFHVPNVVAVPSANIVIDDNDSDGYTGRGSFFYHHTGRPPQISRPDSDIRLLRNVAKNGFRPWLIWDAKGVRMEGNRYSDFAQSALLGFNHLRAGVRDVQIVNDRYTRGGSIGGVGLTVFSASDLVLRNTAFVDCGTGAPGSYAIAFSKGASQRIEMDGVDISAPTGKTRVAIQKDGAHHFDPVTNRVNHCDFHGLHNFFET